MAVISRFFRRAVFSYKNIFGALSWHHYVFFNLSSPIMMMICFSVVAKYAHGGDMAPWLIGNAFVLSEMAAIFGVGTQLSSERNTGTLPMLIASPSSKVAILLPRTLLHLCESFVTSVFGLVIGVVIFGVDLPLFQIPELCLLIVVASFSAMGFGLIVSSFGLITRDLNMLLNIMVMLLLGLTGANFPIANLPSLLQQVPNFLPLTRIIKLSRFLLAGEHLIHHLDLLAIELCMGMLFITIGIFLFRVIERAAIKEGTFNIY